MFVKRIRRLPVRAGAVSKFQLPVHYLASFFLPPLEGGENYPSRPIFFDHRFFIREIKIVIKRNLFSRDERRGEKDLSLSLSLSILVSFSIFMLLGEEKKKKKEEGVVA